MFNPWPSLSPTQARSRKKTAHLIGKEPGKVFVLATFHDWRGRAMRLYHIPKRTMIPFARPWTSGGPSTPRKAWKFLIRAASRQETWMLGVVTPRNRPGTSALLSLSDILPAQQR